MALLLAGAPIQAIVNLVIYVLAWIDLFSFFVPGFTCCGIAVLHALSVINSKKSDRRAQVFGDGNTVFSSKPQG
jgi:hypothetical protein